MPVTLRQTERLLGNEVVLNNARHLHRLPGEFRGRKLGSTRSETAAACNSGDLQLHGPKPHYRFRQSKPGLQPYPKHAPDGRWPDKVAAADAQPCHSRRRLKLARGGVGGEPAAAADQPHQPLGGIRCPCLDQCCWAAVRWHCCSCCRERSLHLDEQGNVEGLGSNLQRHQFVRPTRQSVLYERRRFVRPSAAWPLPASVVRLGLRHRHWRDQRRQLRSAVSNWATVNMMLKITNARPRTP